MPKDDQRFFYLKFLLWLTFIRQGWDESQAKPLVHEFNKTASVSRLLLVQYKVVSYLQVKLHVPYTGNVGLCVMHINNPCNTSQGYFFPQDMLLYISKICIYSGTTITFLLNS